MADQNMAIWLPSPMGDAIMATPALRALRQHFRADRITFVGSGLVRQILSPSPFCDGWIELDKSMLHNMSRIRRENFSTILLLKNSFGSALTSLLAGMPKRIGYARDGRSWMLTEKIQPLKDAGGKFIPTPAIDYYLKIAENLGAETADRSMDLAVSDSDTEKLRRKLPAVFDKTGPLVILVPGGAFGPSKCWPSERFSKVADTLIEHYKATVVLSIAPNPQEKQIAADIQRHAQHTLLNLGEHPLGLGVLKALFARADLVVANDTGPRHIAIALKRKIVTLFGPNNPQWTQTGYADEIQIIGQGPCVPCDKPICKQKQHYCMESITVEQVLEAAQKYLAEGAG